MPRITWSGILAFEGRSTNEMGSMGGRFIDEGALEWETPIPLRIVMEDKGEHDGAITVGSVDEIVREEDGVIRGRGRFDAGSPMGLEAARLASEGYKRSISIDPGNADRAMRVLDSAGNELNPEDFESPDELPDDIEIQEALTSARIRGATIVDIPAFEGAVIEEVEVTEDEEDTEEEVEAMVASLAEPSSITAAAVPPHSTDVASSDIDWDGNEAEKALPTGEEASFYRRFYGYQDPDTDGTAKDHWHYIHHFVEGAGPDAAVGAASVEAARAIIGLLNGARGVNVAVTGEARTTVYNHMARHMSDAGEQPPELKAESSTTTAGAAPMKMTTDPDPDCDLAELTSLTASAAVDIPALPALHFTPIDFGAPTPLTLDPDTGQVYGHVALSSICHVGMPKCVTMPHSASNLQYFHTGVVRLDDGSDIATGRITVHGAHAALDLPWRSALAHYDNASTTVADVVAWEDDHGLAVTGHLRPGTPPELVHAFRGSTPSGDWRRIGSSAELINIHMVNSPGFPVYRTDGDRLETTITAAAVPAQIRGDTPPATPDLSQFSDEVAAKVVSIMEANREADEAAAAIAPHRDLNADLIARNLKRG